MFFKGLQEANTLSKNIPKKYATIISNLVEKLGRNKKDMESLLLKLYEETKSPTLSESRTWQKAFARFRGIIKREDGSIRSPAPVWTGIVFGESGLIDFLMYMRTKAEAAYRRDPARASDDQLTLSDGTVLDTRKKINYGRDDNPNYLRPLDENEHSYYRGIYGVCSKGTQLKDDLQFFRINVNGDNAVNVTIPTRQLVQFRANPRRKNPYGFIDLNAMSTQEMTFVETTEDVVIPDIEGCLSTTTWSPVRTTEIEMAYLVVQSDDKRKRIPSLLIANVGTIDARINENTGKRTLWLDDPDVAFDQPGIACFIPGEIPIEFGYDSRIIFVGEIRTMGEEDDIKYIFDAMGYYALPGLTYPLTEDLEYPT